MQQEQQQQLDDERRRQRETMMDHLFDDHSDSDEEDKEMAVETKEANDNGRKSNGDIITPNTAMEESNSRSLESKGTDAESDASEEQEFAAKNNTPNQSRQEEDSAGATEKDKHDAEEEDQKLLFQGEEKEEEEEQSDDAEFNEEDHEIRGRKAPVRRARVQGDEEDIPASSSSLTGPNDAVLMSDRPSLVKVPDLPLDLFRQKSVTLHMAQLPKIVAIQPEVYDEDHYNASVEEAEFQGRVHSMIRWRYKLDTDGRHVRDENGKLVKESNAKIIKWDDGTYGLCVGDEVFDMDEFTYQLEQKRSKVAANAPTKNQNLTATAGSTMMNVPPVVSSKDFLFVTKDAVGEFDNGETQPMGTILECVASLQSKFIPRPASLKSAAHKNFVLQERSRVIKRAQIQEYVTFVDPEKQKAERIRNKEDLMKQEKRNEGRRSTGNAGGGRRRYAMQRAYMEEDEDNGQYDNINIGNLKRRNMDDEDMDYGDDAGMSDEEDVWSKRKKKEFERSRKTSHMQKYESEEEEDAKEDNGEQEFMMDEDDDDDEELVSRKRRTSAAGKKRQFAMFDDDDDDDEDD